MSTATTVNNTSNQMHTDYDNSIIFLGGNRYNTGTYTNGTGDEVTLEAGTLLGRVSASGALLPLASAAVDDSNIPVGILSHSVTVADSASAELTYCVKGDVAEEKIIFDGSDDLDTVVGDRQLRDHIEGGTVGINLVASTSMTGYDNQ